MRWPLMRWQPGQPFWVAIPAVTGTFAEATILVAALFVGKGVAVTVAAVVSALVGYGVHRTMTPYVALVATLSLPLSIILMAVVLSR